MYSKELIENTFLPHLQTDLKFMVENKTIKTGKLLLVTQKGPYVSFFLILPTSPTPKTYDIPYPFDIVTTNDYVCFDYRIEALCKHKKQTTQLAEDLLPEKSNRLLNKQLKIIPSFVDICK